MSRYYRRMEPGAGENLRAGLVAGALAAATAAVSFYFVRLFLSREPLDPLTPSRHDVLQGKEGPGFLSSESPGENEAK